MLDGLLGRSGFSSKCKSLIKPTRTRIEVLRRRAEAKQRFLKEDLAKLLANGLDVNAYGRTEDFIAGLNMLSCYNFIDQSCEYILKQLSVMQKLGQCPEECRETVASLMFAAARFSDLPELRDLRDVFQDRYGNGLECYVNQMFVEKLASKPPVVEKRIKLLQDIAVEFSIQWDSKGFKERMDKPSILAQPLSVSDDSKYKVQNGNNVFRKTDRTHEGPKVHNGDKYKVPNGTDHRSKEKLEQTYDGPPSYDNGNNVFRKIGTHEGPKSHNDDKYKVPNGNYVPNKHDQRSKERLEQKYDVPPSYDNGNNVFRKTDRTHEGPKLHNDDKYKVPNGNIISNKNDHRAKEKLEQSYDRPPSYDNHEGPKLHIDDKYKVPNGNIIPNRNDQRSKERLEQSYDRPALYDNGTNINARRKEVSDIPFVGRERHVSKPETIDTRDNNNNSDHSKTPRSSRDRRPDFFYNGKPEDVEKSTEKEKEPIRLLKPPYIKSNIPPPYTKPNNHHHRQPSGDPPTENPPTRREKEQDDRHYYQNEIPLPKPRSVRRKHSKSSSSHDDVGSSEDSRIVKRISSSRRKERKGLQILFDDEHYHRKDDDEEKMMDKLLLHYSKKPSSYDGKLKKKKSRSSNKSPRHEVLNDEVETVVVPPVRSVSLPHETEPKKVYARANSFQPDNQAPHVHPKLPDYDDLAARFAALRGR